MICECGQDEVVGQKDQSFSGLGIFEPDSAQWRIEALARKKGREHDAFADQARAFVDFAGVAALDFEIGLVRVTKKTACIAQSKKALEIDVAAIHHVEGSRFDINSSSKLISWYLPSLM
jgi:hypothetical protein